MKDKLVLSLWPHCQQQLNSGQEHSVMTSIQNKFQLIQGPPGTAAYYHVTILTVKYDNVLSI